MSAEPAPVPLRFPMPRSAKARLRTSVELPDYLPARMLNEFVYCPRLFFYEWVEEIRRLVPARDDLRPLYVTGYGLSVGKSDDVLKIRDKDGVVQEARLHDISQVNVFGNVTLTSAAVQALCWSGKPIAYFSSGHWFYGLTTGMGLKNVFLRRDQFARAGDPDFCLQVARDMVSTKIRNQRTLLQRNHLEPPARALMRKSFDRLFCSNWISATVQSRPH